MESDKPLINRTEFTFEKIVDTMIRLAILFFLAGWCVTILRPFFLILIWAAVIAIAIYPLYRVFIVIFRNRRSWAAVVLTILMLAVLVIPSWLVLDASLDEVRHLRDLNNQGRLVIPPPGERTDNWPRIMKPIIDFWSLASGNLQSAVVKYSDQLKVVGAWLLSTAAGFGKGILQFVVSMIIAGILLAYSATVGNAATGIFVKLAGKNGETFADTIVTTVRSVVKGILGVAVIQAVMAGTGFFIAGVPYAGLWTVASLFFAIIQIGAGPVAIPVMIYMFSATDTLTAVLLAIWLVITLISDNILKPLLLGRGAPAPMLVVFLGAIGGFIANGFLGLFLGAVILTIGYKLFSLWLNTPSQFDVVGATQKIKDVRVLIVPAVMTLMFSCNTKMDEHKVIAIDKVELKKAIQTKEDEFAATYNSGELKNIGYYAEDAISFSQNKPPLVGKAAIIEFLKEGIESSTNGNKISFTTNEVFVSSDGHQVVEIGYYKLVDSTNVEINTGNYMVLFEKRDGKYVVVRDMSASDMPLE